MSTTQYETRAELQPRETHALDVSDLDYETVVEYVESRDLDAHFERTGERVLLVVA
jgi:hypothetical protein